MRYKTKAISLASVLDTRSSPDEVKEGFVRWRQNIRVSEFGDSKGKVCRRPMFDKFLSATPYVNQDLHDQLLPLQYRYADQDPKADGADDITAWPSALCTGGLVAGTQGREPITLLQEAVSSYGQRKLFVGTATRLYEYSAFLKNYRLLLDNQEASRFSVALNNDVLTITNGINPVVNHFFGQLHQGCGINAVRPIPDLEAIKLASAAKVVSWKGLTILLDVTMDGVRLPNRMVWSDFRKPWSYVPSSDSVAGFQDLAPGESILNALPLGDQLIVYTDKSIWTVTVNSTATGPAQNPLSFFQFYTDTENSNRTLAYRNALTSLGHSHLYASRDGIYLFSTVLPEPERPLWLHLSTDQIYDDLNESACDQMIMGFDPKHQEVVISWPQAGQTINSRTLIANIQPEYQTADIVDHGFTAIENYTPDDQETLGDFFLRHGLCDAESLAALDEKTPCPVNTPDPDCEPASIWNAEEDFDEDIDENSLCACLDDDKVADLCSPCLTESVLVVASSQDYCLKQFGTQYYKQICTNPTAEGVTNGSCYTSPAGTYVNQGYYSILRGIMHFNSDEDKLLSAVNLIGKYPEASLGTRLLDLHIGVSQEPHDPNLLTTKTAPYNRTTNPTNGTCRVRWSSVGGIQWKCPETLTPEEMLDDNLLESSANDWNCFLQGEWTYYELAFVNSDTPKSAPRDAAGCMGKMLVTHGEVKGCK